MSAISTPLATARVSQRQSCTPKHNSNAYSSLRLPTRLISAALYQACTESDLLNQDLRKNPSLEQMKETECERAWVELARDFAAIQGCSFTSSGDWALEAAKKLAEDKDARRLGAGARTSTYLLVLTALIPLLATWKVFYEARHSAALRGD